MALIPTEDRRRKGTGKARRKLKRSFYLLLDELFESSFMVRSDSGEFLLFDWGSPNQEEKIWISFFSIFIKYCGRNDIFVRSMRCNLIKEREWN